MADQELVLAVGVVFHRLGERLILRVGVGLHFGVDSGVPEEGRRGGAERGETCRIQGDRSVGDRSIRSRRQALIGRLLRRRQCRRKISGNTGCIQHQRAADHRTIRGTGQRGEAIIGVDLDLLVGQRRGAERRQSLRPQAGNAGRIDNVLQSVAGEAWYWE